MSANANVSLNIHISQDFQNPDRSNRWLDFISPQLPRLIISDSTSVNGVSSHLESHFQLEPCGLDRYFSLYNDGRAYFEFNVTFYQEVINFPNLMMGNATILVDFDEITVDSFPYHYDHFLADGFYRYRAISLKGPYTYNDPIYPSDIKHTSPDYENKDFVVQISTPDAPLSDYITEVIFATGDQCIWDYDISCEDRFVKQIPQNVGNSWNITVGPARISDWYIAFGTINKNKEVNVNYILVDRPDRPVSSSSYIHYVDFNLIIVFILSILLHK